MVGEPRGSFHLDWGLSLVKWRTIPNVHSSPMHIVTFSLITMSEKQEKALHINPLQVDKGSRLYRSNVGHGMISWSDQSGVKHTQTPHYLKQSQCRALSWSLIIKKSLTRTKNRVLEVPWSIAPTSGPKSLKSPPDAILQPQICLRCWQKPLSNDAFGKSLQHLTRLVR